MRLLPRWRKDKLERQFDKGVQPAYDGDLGRLFDEGVRLAGISYADDFILELEAEKFAHELDLFADHVRNRAEGLRRLARETYKT